MKATLLIDFGSTYTKVTAVDLDSEALLGRTQAPSTAGSDLVLGLNAALHSLKLETGIRVAEIPTRLACSSAAGGLRMVAIGLVPDLTAEAARQAALGAGAKLLKVYSYALTHSDIDSLESITPDLVLLAGGTDGGNSDFILRNAVALASSGVSAPIVVAGNRAARDEVCSILVGAGKEAIPTENVLPELSRLNVDPARSAIREVFMRRIVRAKGLDGAESFVGSILMPTPLAVLRAAELLADGAGGEEGLGELLLVDVGGATTDVHSIARGSPRRDGVVQKGIPEPHAKRTVEGDLGLRYNAPSIVDAVGEEAVLSHAGLDGSPIRPREAATALTRLTDKLPSDELESALDVGLARAATLVAVERHAGTLETVYTPAGRVDVQHGKDLTVVKTLIGTGGVFAWGSNPRRVLEGALYDPGNPLSLRPICPRMLVDAGYILYAVGLLAGIAPDAALRVAKGLLKEV